MRKLLLIGILIFTIGIIAACGGGDDGNGANGGDGDAGGSLEALQEAGVVTIGFANEEPYAYEDNDGELRGAAVDIAAAVFAELGIEEMDSQLADFDSLIPGLQANQFDVVTAGMAITPDRCENALFGEPEMVYGEGLVVQAGNPLDIQSYDDIAANPDIRVSVMAGATEIGFLEDHDVRDDQITTASDIPSTFSAVESDRADVTTATEMTLRLAMETADEEALEFVEGFEQPDVEGVPSYGSAAFSLENEELRDAYNEALNDLKEDGTVEELLEANGFVDNMVEVDEVTAESVCSGENY